MMLPSSAISILTLFLQGSNLRTTSAATPDEWRTRSIYQIMTDRFALDGGGDSTECTNTSVPTRERCGGNWKGLKDNLDYIQDLGFDAIWISPISKNIEDDTLYGKAYHGYWTQNLDQLNPYFGSEEDLMDLIDEVHDRDMYIMVDTVPNHFAHGPVSSTPVLTGPNRNIDLSAYTPFNEPEQFHTPCWVDYSNDTSVEVCWMGDENVPLMDLATDLPFVNQTLVEYIANSTSTYGLDGLRVDAVKSINKNFWRPWNDAAGVYALGEYYTGSPSLMCDYQTDALDGLLNFPVWESVVQSFNDTDRSLAPVQSTAQSVASLCTDSTLLGSFIENQDLPRFRAYTRDDALSHNAITYTMLTDGIPVLYYGYEQGFSGDSDPANREALWSSGYSKNTAQYGWVKTLNKFRKSMIYADILYQPTEKTDLVTSDAAHVLAFHKGYSIVVTNNYGSVSSASRSVTVETSWPGETVLELWTNATMTVPADGNLQLDVDSGVPMVFYPQGLAACVASSSNATCFASARSVNTSSTSRPTTSGSAGPRSSARSTILASGTAVASGTAAASGTSSATSGSVTSYELTSVMLLSFATVAGLVFF